MDPMGSIETNDQLMLYMDGYFCARGLGFESGYAGPVTIPDS